MKKRILCFGDSNTWGANPQDWSRYPESTRWTGVLQDELGEAYQIIEEGYNGRTTVFDDVVEGRLSGITYFAPCCSSQSPLDLVVLMLGTNDLKVRFGVDANAIACGLQQYADVLTITPWEGEMPKVLLVSPLLIDEAYRTHPLLGEMFGENAVERSKRFAQAYKTFAAEHGWEYLDAAQYAKASSCDGIHMEAEEHKTLGMAFAEKVKAILG